MSCRTFAPELRPWRLVDKNADFVSCRLITPRRELENVPAIMSHGGRPPAFAPRPIAAMDGARDHD
jgi:hypothetical protein